MSRSSSRRSISTTLDSSTLRHHTSARSGRVDAPVMGPPATRASRCSVARASVSTSRESEIGPRAGIRPRTTPRRALMIRRQCETRIFSSSTTPRASRRSAKHKRSKAALRSSRGDAARAARRFAVRSAPATRWSLVGSFADPGGLAVGDVMACGDPPDVDRVAPYRQRTHTSLDDGAFASGDDVRRRSWVTRQVASGSLTSALGGHQPSVVARDLDRVPGRAVGTPRSDGRRPWRPMFRPSQVATRS